MNSSVLMLEVFIIVSLDELSKGSDRIRNRWNSSKLNYLTETTIEEKNFRGTESLETEWKNFKTKWKVITKKGRKENINKCWKWWELTNKSSSSSTRKKKRKEKKLLLKLNKFMTRKKEIKICLKINKQRKGWNFLKIKTIQNISINWKKQRITK